MSASNSPSAGAVGSHLSNQGAFDARNYGFEKKSELFGSIDVFEMKHAKNGAQTIYRVRNKKRKKSPPPVGPLSL